MPPWRIHLLAATLLPTAAFTFSLQTTKPAQQQEQQPKPFIPTNGAVAPPSIVASLDPTVFANDFLANFQTYNIKKQDEQRSNYTWVDNFESSQAGSKRRPISLLSWNILAQSLYEQQQRAGTTIIPWEQRLEWILVTLKDANADIVCLQEVENKDVFNDIEVMMSQWGYDGVIQGGGEIKEIQRRKGKTQRAHFVATFWKRHVLEPACMIPDKNSNKRQQDGTMMYAHMARGRTLTSLLKTRQETNDDSSSEETGVSSPLVLSVVNCHLEGHPNQYAARIRQLQHALTDLAPRVGDNNNNNKPPSQQQHGLVIAGDFNCELASSACSTYLRMGRVGRKGGLGGIHGTAALAIPPYILESDEATQVLNPIMEWGQALPNDDMESVKPHAFRRNSLQSAYPPDMDVKVHFTYCARPFRPVSGLDQIWYSSSTLQRTALKRALSSPTACNIILHTGLPEPMLQQPSDHLPVGALFEWKTCDDAAEECDLTRASCTDAGVRELVVVPDRPPPAPKPISPILAYTELDYLRSTCAYDSDSQRIQLEAILEHKLPPKDQKPSQEEIVKLREIRDQKKTLLETASQPVRQVLQRILKLHKEVSKYEEDMFGFS